MILIEPRVIRDDRGFFFEAWNQQAFFQATGQALDFRQDNHSRSVKGVLRGLHYQVPPHPQGKLIRVVMGSIWDAAVDIRRSSTTFGRWAGVELTAENHRLLWIPPGFAHGFITLSDSADVLYKTTDYYSAVHDRSIRWDDPDIAVEWPIGSVPMLSDKDRNAPYLRDADVFP